MRDAHHVLLDDRPVVQHLGHIMAGCADQLHAPPERLMIRLCSHKRGKKRVVNVDDPVRVLADEVGGKNLHVARQDDQINSMVAQQSELPGFRLRLVVLAHRHFEKRDTVEVSQPSAIRVVADNEWNFACQLAALVAVQQIGKAMVVMRDKDRHLGLVARKRQPPIHLEPLCDGRKRGGELLGGHGESRQVPFHPHQEEPELGVLMFIGVQDVAVPLVNEIGNGRYQALTVGATYQQNGAVLHAAGVAVFLGGLKKGSLLTVAGTLWRTASTVISISSRVPGSAFSRATLASAIIFFNTGDHVVEVALPTCVPPRYTGTATRDAVLGVVGTSPTASYNFSTDGQSISSPTSCRRGRPFSACSAALPTKCSFSRCTSLPSPISKGEYFCSSIRDFLLLM